MLQSSVHALLTQQLPRLPLDCVGVRFRRCWHSNRVYLVRGLAGRCRLPDHFGSSSIDKTTYCHEQEAIQGQFWSRVLLDWIQSFPSPTLIALPRLKSPISPTIYSKLVGEHAFPKGISKKWNAVSLVQLWLPIPFPLTINITLSTPQKNYK